jgi:hypothetical protein
MPGLFLRCSRLSLLTPAAEGALEPAAVSQFRGAYLHRKSSYALVDLVGLFRSWRTIYSYLGISALQKVRIIPLITRKWSSGWATIRELSGRPANADTSPNVNLKVAPENTFQISEK